MTTDIGIWRIDRESRSGSKLDPADRIETEKMLEDVLVANPNILMGGLTLVGRQVPVGSGYIDLLGIDEDGRLMVFELKREKLTREAVAQVLDYCTYLETLSNSELSTLIAECSGKHGIRRIADFDEWYASQAGDVLRPVRMVLVVLTRFRGHLTLTTKGVHDAKDKKTIPTGVSRANGRAGSSRPYAWGTVAGVRAVGAVDRQLGGASRSRRGQAQGWVDECRA